MDKQRKFREARPESSQRIASIREKRSPIALLLDEVEDPRNVGAIFRLADAARLREVIIRSAKGADWQPAQKIVRISRSTTRFTPFRGIGKQTKELQLLEQEYTILLLEWTTNSQSIYQHQWDFSKPVLLILGNEERGIHPEILQASYPAVHIPMLGVNTSMNVAHAASIASYWALGQLPTETFE